jgi:hypothetical protein
MFSISVSSCSRYNARQTLNWTNQCPLFVTVRHIFETSEDDHPSLVSHARDHWWTLDFANAFVSPGGISTLALRFAPSARGLVNCWQYYTSNNYYLKASKFDKMFPRWVPNNILCAFSVFLPSSIYLLIPAYIPALGTWSLSLFSQFMPEWFLYFGCLRRLPTVARGMFDGPVRELSHAIAWSKQNKNWPGFS